VRSWLVAAVLAAGSEKAAAHCLGLSHSTVKHHLANARSKVGVETTAQLVWILGPRLPEPEAPGGSPGGFAPDPAAAETRLRQMRLRSTNRPASRLDFLVLPLLVDAWIDRLRRHGR
jgi:hypothetical protein